MTMTRCSLDASVEELLRVSRIYASRMGLLQDDVEDCAVEFVEHLLCRESLTDHEKVSLRSTAWVHRCAHNHAVDYCRSLRRRSHWHAPWPTRIEHGGAEVLGDDPESTVGPAAVVMNREFWEIVGGILDELGAAAEDLFLQRYFYELRLADLARTSGRSEEAVEQSIRRARRHVRVLLERRGITEAMLRAYLTEPSPAAHGIVHAVVRSPSRNSGE